VAVFASFLGALVAATALSLRERRLRSAAVAAAGVVCVAIVLALNLRRLDPVVSLAASAAVSLLLWRAWVARGRPGGVARIAR
jgi:threonine/homoserine efflux transporter RhtA